MLNVIDQLRSEPVPVLHTFMHFCLHVWKIDGISRISTYSKTSGVEIARGLILCLRFQGDEVLMQGKRQGGLVYFQSPTSAWARGLKGD